MLTFNLPSRIKPLSLAMFSIGFIACTDQVPMTANKATSNSEAPSLTAPESKVTNEQYRDGKPVVYQVFTRLFGNTNTTNKRWGTWDENGVGKFRDLFFVGRVVWI